MKKNLAIMLLFISAWSFSQAQTVWEPQKSTGETHWHAQYDKKFNLSPKQQAKLKRAAGTVKLGSPLKEAPGYFTYNTWLISNYVDQDPTSGIQDYNNGSHAYNGHRGTDFATWPFSWRMVQDDQVHVVAAAAGTIEFKADGNPDDHCDWNQPEGWNAVYIRHADGVLAMYGHLKNGSVTSKALGETVEEGEYLGVVASSGISDGPHLHFELHEPNGAVIDPFYGPNNPSLPESCWKNQESYRREDILTMTISTQAPQFNAGCPNVENGFEKYTGWQGGQRLFLGRAYRHQSMVESQINIYDPNGNLFWNFAHTPPSSYNWGSSWVVEFDLPANPIVGTWTYEVVHKGKSYQRIFDVGFTQTPFNTLPQTIPGLVEAEFYDVGGQNVAYFDTDGGNSGNFLRSDDVDVEPGSQNGNVGWTQNGEWLEYSVVVQQDGNYTMNAQVASIHNGTAFNLQVDGDALTGNITVPNTGNWQSYQTVSASQLALKAGYHVLRMNVVQGGFNIDDFNFVLDQVTADIDNDGFMAGEDCNDLDDQINPGSNEIHNNGVDDNCDGVAVAYAFSLDKTTICVGESVTATLTANEGVDQFEWRFQGITPNQTFTGEGPITTSFDAIGNVTVLMSVVIDGQTFSAPSQTIAVTTCGPNNPPIVGAGDFKQITLPTNSITVTDAVAIDNDGTIVSTVWSQDEGPSTATITNGTTISPTFSALVEGLYTFRLVATDNDNASTAGTVNVRVHPADDNQPPVVAAGDFKQITFPANSITVSDASATDSDGSIASLSWTQESGPSTATITNGTTVSPTFSALEIGLYEFRLTATDDDGASSSATVSVRVNEGENQPPVVGAGDFKQITFPANSVTVNDATATDSDGSIASLSWTQESGPSTATITNGTTISPTFSALEIGLYEFRLTATDDDGASSSSTVSVRVNEGENQAPFVGAGDFKQMDLPQNSVTVNDATATDNDGTIASLLWTQDSGPNTATITNGTTLTPTFSDLVLGSYEFRLTATDDDGASTSGTVTVTVNPENQPPVVGAGDFKQLTLPTNSVTINDATVTDSDGWIASVLWTQDSGPNTATITNGATNAATFSNLVEGLYEFRLTATDNDGATSFGIVSVRVDPAMTNDCVGEGANPAEYSYELEENGNALTITFIPANSQYGAGFCFLDYYLNGSKIGSFSMSGNPNRTYTINGLNNGTEVEWFFKYSAPYGQYAPTQADHAHTMGSCGASARIGATEAVSALKLYPNPTTDGDVFINYQGTAFIEVINANGDKVFEQSYNAGLGIALGSDLASGVYYVKITTDNEVIVETLIKQ